MSEAMYMLKAVCHVGCSREILGPLRQSSDPDFTTEQIEEFFQSVERAGWKIQEIDTGEFLFFCNKDDCMPWNERVKKSLREDFRVPDKRRRLRLARPEFFGTARVENL